MLTQWPAAPFQGIMTGNILYNIYKITRKRSEEAYKEEQMATSLMMLHMEKAVNMLDMLNTLDEYFQS